MRAEWAANRSRPRTSGHGTVQTFVHWHSARLGVGSSVGKAVSAGDDYAASGERGGGAAPRPIDDGAASEGASLRSASPSTEDATWMRSVEAGPMSTVRVAIVGLGYWGP